MYDYCVSIEPLALTGMHRGFFLFRIKKERPYNLTIYDLKLRIIRMSWEWEWFGIRNIKCYIHDRFFSYKYQQVCVFHDCLNLTTIVCYDVLGVALVRIVDNELPEVFQWYVSHNRIKMFVVPGCATIN